MRIHVQVFGALTKPFGKDDFEFEVRDGARVEELLLALGYPPTHARFIVPLIGGERQPQSRVLAPGDEVMLMVPASGG